MSNSKKYYRGTFHTLTRAMLGADAAAHGFRVAENLLNDRSRRVSWSMSILGQVHDWAEDTDLTVDEVTRMVCDHMSWGEGSYAEHAVGVALRAVTRRGGELYADFIERVCASSSLAVRLKIADVRVNIARCLESPKGSLLGRYTAALVKLEAAEAGWLESEEEARRAHGEDRLTGEEYAAALGLASESY
jgi:hypothetical protein